VASYGIDSATVLGLPAYLYTAQYNRTYTAP